MLPTVRYLLLQVRNPDDPMRAHEVECFARALETSAERISVIDMLEERVSGVRLAAADVVLLGGSGHYSVAHETSLAEPAEEWLKRAFDVLRDLPARGKPTFASCWGFQAMARALGGQVVHDAERAEIGTHSLRLTTSGHDDPVFGPLGATFLGQMGHQDRVLELPSVVTLLASSDKVKNQAYRLDGAPIYCTQFHPELNRADLLRRLDAYPEYVRHVTGMPLDEFADTIRDSPHTEALLPRFVRQVLD